MAEYRAARRRYSMEYEEEEDDNGLRLIRKSGIPLLYIVASCANLIGMICLGIITDYWANIDVPTCFLYSQTASSSVVYTFGSPLPNCYWVTYGSLPSTIIIIGSGIFYMIAIFGDPMDKDEEDALARHTRVLTVLMSVATVIQIAVCSTLAEGMRITCTNMGLNAVNGKAVTCMDKLNLRVAQYQLPVQTSTMVTAGSMGLWTGTIALLFLVVCHVISLCRVR